MEESKEKRIGRQEEDSQKSSSLVIEEDIFLSMEEMSPEEKREYLDDLFRSYVFGKG